MKKIILLLLSFSISRLASAEDWLYKATLNSFFDNTEFAHSRVQIPQTMAGIHVAPEVGVGFGERHRIFAGIDLMHEWGSSKAIDFFDPIAYYVFNGKYFRAYIGAFPRSFALERYPRMFFQDSILNYRPIVNGIFWEYRYDKSYFNLWLDWVSRQTRTRHEAFFMGWSGRFAYGVFYAQHFGYMFHFAGKKDPETEEGLHDNGLALTSVGVDFAEKTEFNKLELNVGWSIGLERERCFHKWYFPKGVLAELHVEYKGLGLFDSFYRGGSQQVFYADHGGELYFGDPIYRANCYNRTDIYINFFQSKKLTVRMTYSLHFAEGNVYHEQMLKAAITLGNLKEKEEKKYEYIWDKLFK